MVRYSVWFWPSLTSREWKCSQTRWLKSFDSCSPKTIQICLTHGQKVIFHLFGPPSPLSSFQLSAPRSGVSLTSTSQCKTTRLPHFFFLFFFSQATKHNKISLYEHCSLRCGIPISKRTNNVKNVLIPPALCFHSISRYGLRDAPVFASGGEIAYCAGAGGNRPFIYNWYELNSWGCCSGDINRTHGRCRPTRRGACELPRQSQPVKGYLNDGSSISQRHLFSHWKVNCRPLLNSSEG